MVDNALDLAAVEVEFAGYGALAMTSVVPGQYRLFHGWCGGEFAWCVDVVDRHGLAQVRRVAERGVALAFSPDECHEEFVLQGSRR